MTTYTLQDLMYAKGTSEPVRQALQAQAAEIERLQSEVVNAKQHLGLSHVALALATQEANKYRYLREHHAKAILGSCFWFHATGDGQDDLDKLVFDALESKHEKSN